MKNGLAVFEELEIRRVYDEETETWYFSVIDIVQVLTAQTDYQTARKYWNKLKERLKKEGNESVTNCHRLKLEASDGKKYLTDVANAETLLRLVQSIPSPKAEPIKLWLAKVGCERMQEMADPAKSLDRARETWQKHGYSEKWIQQRMMGQETRNKLTDYWKEHGVESSMKSKWEIKKLGEVLTIERGGSPRPIDKYITNSPNGINWIKISDATASDKYIYKTKEKITKAGLHKTRIVNPGDFILSNSMSFGRPYIMKTQGCIHDGWLVLKQNKEKIFETEFLYYLLSSPLVSQQFNFKAAGSTVRNLNITLVSSVEVPIPTLTEQQRIVAILDKAFAAIEKAKSNAEQNLKNAKKLFDSYLQNLFRNKLKNWEEKILNEVCDLISKGSSPKWQGIKYIDQPGVLFITSENVGENTLLLNQRKYVEEKFNIKDKKSILKDGDVLTNIVGASIGRTAIYKLNDIANINQAVCLIRTNKNLLLNEYLMYLLNSPFTKQHLHDNEVNNARANLSLSFFRSLLIPLPELSEQKLIVNKIKLFHLEAKKLEAICQSKINKLEELKKSLLQKAFTGQLTHAESSIESLI